MATRVSFESSSEVGVFAKLTNKYCLIAAAGSESFYSIFNEELSPHMPVIPCSIGQCKIVGRLTVGNCRGLLVPQITTDMELQEIRNHLPESIRIERIEERLSALGNVIACNDNVALIHPELDDMSVQIV